MMNSDLRSRIVPAILYVSAILGATLVGTWPSIVLLWVFYTVCLYEFLQVEVGTNRLLFIISFIANQFFISTAILQTPFTTYSVTIIGAIFFIVNALYLILLKKVLLSNIYTPLAALLYLTIPFYAMIRFVQIDSTSTLLLLAIFILIWLTDTGAYFFGRRFGKHKLFPSISPGKTWEGMVGGGVTTILTALILAQIMGQLSLHLWVKSAVIIWLSAVVGDLVQSAWKRHHNIKDSGTIMGGHGGFLDRLDSFIYVSPFIYLLIVSTQ